MNSFQFYDLNQATRERLSNMPQGSVAYVYTLLVDGVPKASLYEQCGALCLHKVPPPSITRVRPGRADGEAHDTFYLAGIVDPVRREYVRGLQAHELHHLFSEHEAATYAANLLGRGYALTSTWTGESAGPSDILPRTFYEISEVCDGRGCTVGARERTVAKALKHLELYIQRHGRIYLN